MKASELFNITKGKKVSIVTDRPTESSLRLIQIEDLRHDNKLKYTEDRLVNVDENDIIIAWDGANVGTIGFGITGIIGSTLARLQIKSEFSNNYNPRYLGYFLSSKFDYFQNTAIGAAIPHISKSAFDNLDIPNPDLETQNKIVAILDKAKTILEQREKTIAKYDDLIEATFLDMFGDPFTNGKKWNLKKLDTLIDFITSGSRGWAKYYGETGNLFLRINNLGYNELLLDDVIFVNEPNTAEASRTVVSTGDVLLSITADLGRTAVIPVDFRKAFINQHIAILRTTSELNPYFLSAFLSSRGGRQLIQKYSKGAAKAALNFDDIRSIQIFDVPYYIQEEFQNKYRAINELKNKVAISKEKFNELVKSLIQQVLNERITIDVDIELEALINAIDLDKNDRDNNIETIKQDLTFVQRLIDRLAEQEFEDKDQYNKAKYILYRIMNEEKNLIKQVFNKKKVILTLNETT